MLSDRDYYGSGDYRRMLRPEGSVLKPLIWLNVIVFLFSEIGPAGAAFQNLLVLHPYYIRHGEVWRLGSYMFAHGGFMHILFNMWGLYMFGQPVEQQLGGRRFLNLYLLSGFLGGLAWLGANWTAPIVAEVVGKVNTVSTHPISAAQLDQLLETYALKRIYGGVVGASGSLFGVMVAAAMAFPTARVALIFPPVVMKLRTMVICYAAIEIWQSFDQSSSIAHLAHLGGALGGFLYMRRLRGDAPGESFLADLAAKWRHWRRRRLFRPVGGSADSGSDSVSDDVLSQEANRVLDKLAQVGYDQLSAADLAVLRAASERLKARRGR